MSALKEFTRKHPTSSTPDTLKSFAMNVLKEQYITLATLMYAIGEYATKHEHFTQRELVAKLFPTQNIKNLSQTQVSLILDGLLSFSKTQQAVNTFYKKHKDNPRTAIEQELKLKHGSLKNNIEIKKGIGVIEIYATPDDYAVLAGDEVTAGLSAGLALNTKTKTPALKQAFVLIKVRDVSIHTHDATVQHESRHQWNKRMFSESLLPQFIPTQLPSSLSADVRLQRLTKIKRKENLLRAKDEIIAHLFEGKPTHFIIDILTRDRGLYDYYFQEKRLRAVSKIRSKLLEVSNKIYRRRGGLRVEIPEHVASPDTIDDIISELTDAKNKMMNMFISEKKPNTPPGIVTGELKILKRVKETLKEIDNDFAELNAIESGGEDWEWHKDMLRQLMPHAENILEKYPKDIAFHLLAITPMHQWKYLS